MCSKEHLEGLLERRDRINDLFLEYTDKRKTNGNIDVLADLALIGGRLDTLIRQHVVRNRPHRSPGGMPRPQR